MLKNVARNDMTTMGKDEALQIHKKMFDIVIEHQKSLQDRKLGHSEFGLEMQIMQFVLADKLFFNTGIEPDELDNCTDRLELEQDDDYNRMVSEFTVEAQKIELKPTDWI